MVTVQALSGGRKSFYLWNRGREENIPEKQKACVNSKNVASSARMPAESLLTHDDAEAAAPAFRKAHANDLQIGRKIFQELVRSGMKSQRGRDEVNERSGLLQFDAGKIAVASDFSALQTGAGCAANSRRPAVAR